MSPRKIVGGILTGLLAVGCGWMGENHHIGFTVSSRFSWGMQGSYFPVTLRIFVACMWFGMQAYWGGQATRVLWGAIIPGEQEWIPFCSRMLTLVIHRLRPHEELLLPELPPLDQRLHRADHMDDGIHSARLGPS
jgi:hypothetical protein